MSVCGPHLSWGAKRPTAERNFRTSSGVSWRHRKDGLWPRVASLSFVQCGQVIRKCVAFSSSFISHFVHYADSCFPWRQAVEASAGWRFKRSWYSATSSAHVLSGTIGSLDPSAIVRWMCCSDTSSMYRRRFRSSLSRFRASLGSVLSGISAIRWSAVVLQSVRSPLSPLDFNR